MLAVERSVYSQSCWLSSLRRDKYGLANVASAPGCSAFEVTAISRLRGSDRSVYPGVSPKKATKVGDNTTSPTEPSITSARAADQIVGRSGTTGVAGLS